MRLRFFASEIYYRVQIKAYTATITTVIVLNISATLATFCKTLQTFVVIIIRIHTLTRTQTRYQESIPAYIRTLSDSLFESRRHVVTFVVIIVRIHKVTFVVILVRIHTVTQANKVKNAYSS